MFHIVVNRLISAVYNREFTHNLRGLHGSVKIYIRTNFCADTTVVRYPEVSVID